MLRPDFTQTIARELQKGKSLNVFGAEGHGLNQFVEDLKTITDANVKFIRISMRSYADRYEGFINDLASQLSVVTTEQQSIELLMNRFIEQSAQNIWLCLEYFERLEQVNTDTKYNRAFLDYLNSLKNNGKVSLLLTSAHQIKTHELFIDGKAVNGSMLETEGKAWADLRLSEIESFLLEKLTSKTALKDFLTKSDIDKNKLIGLISKSAKPFDFMAFFIDNFYLPKGCNSKNFNDLCQKTKQEFDKNQSTSVGNKIGKLNQWLNQLKYQTNRLLEMTKIAQFIVAQWKIILSIIALGCLACYKQVLAFFNF